MVDPTHGPQQNLRRDRYDAVRAAMLAQLRRAGPEGATFDALDEHVRTQVAPGLFPHGGSVRWHDRPLQLPGAA